MKNQLDQRLLLNVVEKVRQHGEAAGNGYILDGLHASTDFDGYTVFLTYQEVTLTLGFHNQYQFDYPNERQLQAFMAKVQQIHQSY